MRSSWITEVGPKYNDRCPYNRGGENTERRRPREDTGRDESNAATKNPNSHQKLEEANDSSLEHPEEV